MSTRHELIDMFLHGGPGSQPEFEALLDTFRPAPAPAPQGDGENTVTLRIVQSGETTVTVDAGEYAEHARDGGVEYLLVTAPARLALRTCAVGPDGTLHDIGPDPDETEPTHLHFGLSYSTHLVLPRTLLQSMPPEWQRAFVHLLDQYEAAFRHVEQPPGYSVEAAEEHEACDLDEAQLKRAGITVDQYGGEEPPPSLTAEELAAWQDEHESTPAYTDADGDDLETDSRVMVPVADPLPYYSRGRTRVTPRLVGEA